MENMNWLNCKIEIRERLKAFSMSILTLSDMIPFSARGNVINHQLTKSGTSMHANYRAALSIAKGKSRNKDFRCMPITVRR